MRRLTQFFICIDSFYTRSTRHQFAQLCQWIKRLRAEVLALKHEMTTVVTAKSMAAVIKLTMTEGAFMYLRKQQGGV